MTSPGIEESHYLWMSKIWKPHLWWRTKKLKKDANSSDWAQGLEEFTWLSELENHQRVGNADISSNRRRLPDWSTGQTWFPQTLQLETKKIINHFTCFGCIVKYFGQKWDGTESVHAVAYKHHQYTEYSCNHHFYHFYHPSSVCFTTGSIWIKTCGAIGANFACNEKYKVTV